MKCEQVQDIFPEILEQPERHPEAKEHVDTCPECKLLFHVFKGIDDDNPVIIDPVKRDLNFVMIQKKMKRHDRVVFTRRVSTVAAVFFLAIVSIFNISQPSGISIADISDDVLYLQSESSLVPDVTVDREGIIEYLAEYGNIESFGELF